MKTEQTRRAIDEAVVAWLVASGASEAQVLGADYSFLDTELSDLLTMLVEDE
jgi:hypothetical protein